MTRRLVLQGLFLLGLAVLLGVSRQWLPRGIAWNGRWPTSSTSAEDAYKMMAQPGDPGFASLSDAIQMHNDKSAAFIDARSTQEYKAGHIPGARSLPFYEMESHQAEALKNVQPSTPLVLYCEGPGCELSFFLGRELQGMGYTNIRIFYGGYPEWQKAGLPVETDTQK